MITLLSESEIFNRAANFYKCLTLFLYRFYLLSRSGYSNHTKSSITIGRPSSILTTANGCQSNCSRPPSPNQQSPSGRQSPSMMPTSDRSELKTGTSSSRIPNPGGEPTRRTPGDEADDHRAPSPKANIRAQASPARQTNTKVHGDRENPSPARSKAIKSPPNRSPLKSHFSRR